MRRMLFVTIACLAPTSVYADACSWLEGWGIEMEAANKSLSPSTRVFMETENPAVNNLVDAPTRMLADWWIVNWLCEAPALDRPARKKEAVKQSEKETAEVAIPPSPVLPALP